MYISTRGTYHKVSAAEAIKLGMVPGGGLFVPESIPVFDGAQIAGMADKTYQEVAEIIFGLYLDGYTSDEIHEAVRQAYNEQNFDHPAIAPLKKLKSSLQILELWHGPTAAFKDMALQITPRFLSKAVQKLNTGKEIVILVATSGDTGKAALEGFKNIPGIKIIVFYPYQGVSKVQELQMTTTDGNNTYVVAVKGNFDDCQTAVKEIFGDQAFNQLLQEKNMEFSSANSINWGRLLPQIVYYFWSYLQLMRQGEIVSGEKINFVVPTGNFGNILAGYYAYRMGLPVHRLICASNENKVLKDAIATGVYDRRRDFIKTNSPSMDILISSNFERFLFEVNGHNPQSLKSWYEQLGRDGYFEVGQEILDKWHDFLEAGFADEQETLETIKKTYDDTGYVLDTHTAVGVRVYEKYCENSGDQTKTVVAATANPFKFNSAVLDAIRGPRPEDNIDEFALVDELTKITGMEMHRAVEGLNQKPVLHHKVVDLAGVQEEIKHILNI